MDEERWMSLEKTQLTISIKWVKLKYSTLVKEWTMNEYDLTIDDYHLFFPDPSIDISSSKILIHYFMITRINILIPHCLQIE